jgi:hypothetical protein
MPFLATLYRHTLGSVIFGISLMVLLATYIAVGSGLPVVREFFEMNEMQFFKAWPILVLSILLCLNLTCVTVERIPLTPPRFGVWTIHMGVIVLVMGMVFYYWHKEEGLAIVFTGQTTAHYYDNSERALYVRFNTPSGNYQIEPKPLPSLPRFKIHDTAGQGRMDRPDLQDLIPTLLWPSKETGLFESVPLAEKFQLPSDLRFDILAYYPYAQIETRPETTTDTARSVIEITIRDPHAHAPGHSEDDGHDHSITRFITADDPSRRATPLPMGIAEHRAVDDTHINELIAASTALHRLEVKLPNYQQTLHVAVGQTCRLGDSGYSLKIESFQPNWITIDKKTVPALTLHVTAPTQTYRRMVLADRAEPTDFKIGEGAGPMGQRQKEPLDRDLAITYAFNDPHGLAASREGGTSLFLTSPQRMVLLHLPAEGAPQVHEARDNRIEFTLGGSMGAPLPVVAQRHLGMHLSDRIVEVPRELRQKDEAGMHQVVRARVRMGGWSREVAVPYAQWAYDSRGWQGGVVPLEGTPFSMQLQLGNTKRPMPARVTLDKFELVNYMGGRPETTNLFRDFKSHVTIFEPHISRSRQGVAHMNNPIYFGGLFDSHWALFQAQWDPQGQRFTVLGIGNRPGVYVMTLGCTMIALGLLYAFYVKPIILRRMKERALAQAATRSRAPKQRAEMVQS